MATRFGAIALLAIGCAPAASTPHPTPAPPRSPPAAENETGVRWVFESVAVARGQLSLGAIGTLRYGESGRRWIVRADGTIEHASRVFPAEIVDARRDGEKFRFIDARGEVHVTTDPLGAPVATLRGPGAKLTSVASGKTAFVAVEESGTLHRSIDGGATWSNTKLAMRPGEIVASLAADRAGRVLVLIHPQRVLASGDDGATFAPLATPGIGADHLFRDEAEGLWVASMAVDAEEAPAAKLLDGPLRFEQAKYARPDDPSPKKGANVQVVAGARVVTVRGDQAPSVTVAPVGGAPSQAYALGTFGSQPELNFAGSGATVVGEIHDQGTRLVRTTDEGRTWDTIGTFPSVRPRGLVVTPSLVALGEQCDHQYKQCNPPIVKVGAEEWRTVDLPARTRFMASAYDAENDRLFVLAHSATGQALYRVSKEGVFTKVDVKLPGHSLFGMTTLRDGTLVIAFDRGQEPTVLLWVGPELTAGKEVELPFAASHLDLVGERGLAFADGRALETLDGGAHWSDVGPALDASIHCAPAGCLVGRDVRVGWDLQTASSTTVPPKAPIAAASPTHTFRCAATGAWSKVPGELPYTANHALLGDVRYIAEPPPDLPRAGPVAISVARGSEAPKKFALLGDDPKDLTVRRWAQTSAGGYVHARYAFASGPGAGGKKYNPVDVAIGWYSATTGKAGKAKLPAVSPFRVGSGSQSALTAIVDGGLLFLPFSGDAPLYFVTDAGKVQTIPRPAKITTPDDAYRSGNTIVLAAIEGPRTTLTMTTDLGKTWSTAIWTTGRDAHLVADGKTPALLLTQRGEFGPEERAVGLLPFDALTPDPPAMLAFDVARATAATRALTACSAAGAYRVKQRDAAPVTVKVSGKGSPELAITAQDTYVHLSREGEACVAAIAGASPDASEEHAYAVVVAPRDLSHSWLLRGMPDSVFEHEARPMSCTKE